MFESAKFKKTFLILILIIVILFVGCAVYYFLIFKQLGREPSPSKEKAPEEILNDLTAPGGNEQIPKEIMENLNAPEQKNSETPDEVLENLTAPK